MGFMDNFKKKPVNEDTYSDGYEDDYYGEFNGYEDPVADEAPMQGATQGAPIGGGISSMGANMGGISLSGAAIEMKVLKPKTFESVPQIADHLLNKRTVVLNLEDADDATSRRIIDFLFGVAYSINGSLKKIATKAYVITPNNVDVDEAKLTSKKKKQPEPQEEEEHEGFGAEI